MRLLLLLSLLLVPRLAAQTPPRIEEVSPPGGATGVAVGTPVVFTFSAPMNTAVTTAQFINSSVPPPNGLTVVRSWNALGTRMTNTPSPAFPAGKAITWFVTGMDTQGNPLAAPFSGAFLTASGGGPVPVLLSVVPAPQSVDVPTNAPVVFTFSEPMNPGRTTAVFRDLEDPDHPVAVAPSWDALSKVLTCTPVSGFRPGRVLVWNLQGEGAAGGSFPGAGGAFTLAGSPAPTGPVTALVSRGQSGAQAGSGPAAMDSLEFVALSATPPLEQAAVVSPVPVTNILTGLPGSAGRLFSHRTADPAAFAASSPPGVYRLQVATTNGVEGVEVPLGDGALPAAPRLEWSPDGARILLGQPLAIGWTLPGGDAPVDHVRVEVRVRGTPVYSSPPPGIPGALTAVSNRVVVPGAAFTRTGPAEIAVSAFHVAGSATNEVAGIVLRAARHRSARVATRVLDPATPEPRLRFAAMTALPVGESVAVPVRIRDGARPVRFEIASGTLPEGLALDPSGAISGRATAAGTRDVTLLMTDALGRQVTAPMRVGATGVPFERAPRLEGVEVRDGAAVRFDVVGGLGAEVRLEGSADLARWEPESEFTPASDRQGLTVPVTGTTRFFRVTRTGPTGPPPQPLRVQTVLRPGAVAESVVGPSGGTLRLTNALGRVCTLEIPPGALGHDERIRLAEVARVDGLPFAGGLDMAVDIQPAGLLLETAARLRFGGAPLPAPGAWIGFQAGSDGRGLSLLPGVQGADISFRLLVLAPTGIAPATLPEVQAQVGRVPDDPLLAAGQDVAALRFACAAGDCGGVVLPGRDPGGRPAVAAGGGAPDPVVDRYVQVGRTQVLPVLKTAAESDDDGTLDNAILVWRRWLEEMQALGIADDLTGQDREGDLAGCMQAAAGLAARAIWNGMTRACQKCLEHDLARIGRLESLARTAVSAGWSYDSYYFDCARRCLSFEVSIESKLTQTGSSGTFSAETRARFRLDPWEGDFNNALLGGGFAGEGEWTVTQVTDSNTRCPITHAPVNGQASLPMVRLRLFQQRCDYVPGQGLVLARVYFPDLRMYLKANPDLMPREARTQRCPKDDPLDLEDLFPVSFLLMHQETTETPEVIGEPCIRLEGFETMGVAEVLFRKEYVESRTLSNSSIEERTTVELVHKPQ